MVPSHDEFLNRRYFDGLDGLRALSVLAVVWHHTVGTGRAGFSGRGFLGVDFFFAISGFLITSLLLRERAAHGSISLRGFYLRRTLRIFPLYFAVLLAYIGLTATTETDHAKKAYFFSHLWSFATYTTNWFVNITQGTGVTFYFAWSLATEEQFYLLWPITLIALLAISRGRLVVPALAMTGLIVVDQLVGAAAHGHHRTLAVTIITSLATPICAGAVLAIALHARSSYERIVRVIGEPWFLPVVFVALVATIAFGTPVLVIQLLMAVFVATLCVVPAPRFVGPLSWRPLRHIGVVSYGIYLMHMLVANVVRKAVGEQHQLVVFALTVPLAIAAASISHRYFESPILRIKQRFEPSPRRAGSNGADQPAAASHA